MRSCRYILHNMKLYNRSMNMHSQLRLFIVHALGASENRFLFCSFRRHGCSVEGLRKKQVLLSAVRARRGRSKSMMR